MCRVLCRVKRGAAGRPFTGLRLGRGGSLKVGVRHHEVVVCRDLLGVADPSVDDVLRVLLHELGFAAGSHVYEEFRPDFDAGTLDGSENTSVRVPFGVKASREDVDAAGWSLVEGLPEIRLDL